MLASLTSNDHETGDDGGLNATEPKMDADGIRANVQACEADHMSVQPLMRCPHTAWLDYVRLARHLQDAAQYNASKATKTDHGRDSVAMTT